MKLIGLLVTLFGFVVSVMSLGFASSVNGRMFMVLAGIAISLAGIIGILNPAYMKNALWKR